MNKAVLMHTDVHESTKCSDVRDNPRQFHPGLHISYLLHTFLKTEYFELFSRVPAWFSELRHNIVQCRQSDFIGYVWFKVDFLSQFSIRNKLVNSGPQV